MKFLKTKNTVLRTMILVGIMLPFAAQASIVTGTVTDKTTGKPAAGDQVVLLSLTQGMQKVASTKTNAKGHYSINVPDKQMHLIRVDHQKASYYQQVPPGSKHVNVTVYDVAAKVPGIQTEADVLRMQTNSQGLNVIENYFIANKSSPPRTQFSSEAFQIYLPPGAQIQGAQAEGPGGMPVSTTPVKLAGKGHYAFVFPLRPGETRFGISYMLPYTGSRTFTPKVSLPTGDLAVMLPHSMSFKAGASPKFEQVHDKKVPAQTFVARNVKPGQKVQFTVSGKGSMPRELQAQSGSQSKGEATGSSQAESGRPGGGLGPPIDTPGPLHKYRWWIVSSLGLVLVIVAAFLMGGKKKTQDDEDTEPEPSPLTPTATPAAMAAAGPPEVPSPDQVPRAAADTQASAAKKSSDSPPLLQVLKEELFALETEHAEGKLTEEQYAEVKGALGIVLRRALHRQG